MTDPVINPLTSAPWMARFLSALDRGHAVIISGNLSDMQVLDEKFVPFRTALMTMLARLGYDIVALHDPVDEWQCADGSGTGDHKQSSVLSQPPPKPMIDLLRAQREKGKPASTTPGAPSTPATKAKETVDVAVAGGRLVLAQKEMGAAIVFDHVETWFGSSDHQSEDKERAMVVRLQHTIEGRGAAEKGTVAARGLRNALVLVTHRLAAVPTVLVRGNPLVSLIEVGPPTREDRLRFFDAGLKSFYGHEDLEAPAERARVRELFGDLTDGSTLWELEGLRRVSIAEQSSIGDPRALITRYRHGRRDDPWSRLDHGKIAGARTALSQRVIGQDVAIQAMLDLLMSAKVGVSMSDSEGAGGKPKGVFFFVGPTGVGKTELAKGLTELIFGDEGAFCRFDMSEYAVEHAAERLTGAPPGYLGYEAGGQLTNFVRSKPFSLLLFDEIEKAHGKVLDKFLAILEDGRLTDGKGQTAFFQDTVIVFTSNIGAATLSERCEKGIPPYQEVQELFQNEVRNHFHHVLGRPEIHNRLGENVLVFDCLRADYVGQIAWKFLGKLGASATRRRQYTLDVGASHTASPVVQTIVREMEKPGNLAYGGRRVKVLAETLVEKPLNRWIYEHQPPEGARITVSVNPAGQVVFSA